MIGLVTCMCACLYRFGIKKRLLKVGQETTVIHCITNEKFVVMFTLILVKY